MAAHDFADGSDAGWSAGRRGVEDRSNLAEVAGAEEAGGDNGERFCRGGVEVLEAVDGSARDKDGIARAAFHCLAVDGVGKDALKAVGGLFIGVVTVGGGDFRSGGDFELEHGDGASGGLGVDKVADDEASEADLFAGGGWHGCFVFPFWRSGDSISGWDFRCREDDPGDDKTVAKRWHPVCGGTSEKGHPASSLFDSTRDVNCSCLRARDRVVSGI